MELKVWVDGIQRIVCGISDQTTCQEVIYALAHATGKTGRFVLVEKWRTSERSLSPHDKPLELLFKWGEYSNDVQFVLHCLEDATAAVPAAAQPMANSLMSAKSPKFAPKFAGNESLVANSPTVSMTDHQTVTSSSLINSPMSASGTAQPKPYFVDTSRPAPESGTLRPHQQGPSARPAYYQQHARFGSELPQNLACEQTTVLGGVTNSQHRQQPPYRPHDGRQAGNGGSLSVLSQSAHEHLGGSSAFGNNSSFMESSFSSASDLHNVSGQSSSLSSGGGSRRQPIPPSPTTQTRGYVNNNTNIINKYNNNNNNNNDRIVSPVRRPPPPSYEQAMNTRRNNYSSLLITPPPQSTTAASSRSGTPVHPSWTASSSTVPGQWPLGRDQLLKIVESQQTLIGQQENKIRALDNLLDEEQLKMVEKEKQYYERDLDKMQKELQQLEVRRVHIKQSVEELRRQDFEAHLTSMRQNILLATSENRSLAERLINLDAQIGQKRQIAEKLNAELGRDADIGGGGGMVSSIDRFENFNDFDAKLIEFEEKIREKKKSIDNLETTLAKESSLERLAVSLNNLKQLQSSSIDGHQQHSDSDVVDKSSILSPLIKETTPGVWV